MRWNKDTMKRGQRGIKAVFLGFHGVGRTSLLITYTTKEFPSEYIPTVFDNYAVKIHPSCVEGQDYVLGLWDPTGGEDFERLRPLSYPQTDVFILMFSVVDSTFDFERIATYWAPELQEHCSDAPIILVASKVDLRKDGIADTITPKQGQAMAARIRAVRYFEVSSLQYFGLDELFEVVIDVGYKHAEDSYKKVRKKKCIIL